MARAEPKRGGWLTPEDEARVVAAIRRAEALTSGEIRVHIDRRSGADVLHAARRRFARLGMDRTRERNGVLLYVSLARQGFAVVGDEGIHRHVGDEYWSAVRDRLAARFRDGDFAGGLETAILDIGASLSELYPREAHDVNELPDALTYGSTDDEGEGP